MSGARDDVKGSSQADNDEGGKSHGPEDGELHVVRFEELFEVWTQVRNITKRYGVNYFENATDHSWENGSLYTETKLYDPLLLSQGASVAFGGAAESLRTGNIGTGK